MRLVVWNANMAVHLKLPKLIDDLRPDVVVLSECANDEVLSGKFPKPPPWTSMEWVGSNPNKGLAVFTFGRYQVSSKTTIEPVLEWVAVVDIAGPVNFTLIAVWAMNQRASNIGDFPLSNPQPAAALDGYWSYQSGPTIIAGDFNHNVLWDRPGTPDKNHTKTLESARRAGLTSAYHYKTEGNRGKARRGKYAHALLAWTIQ